jgi:hypothetical protein
LSEGNATVTGTRVQFDSTTLKVWQIAGTSTPPTESAWTAIYSSPEMSTTSCRSTGGRLGFVPPNGEYDCLVGDLTLKSWDTSTSAFDITEATENFTLDGSSYADDTLTSDNNGNQTYDGLQAYTYDAWNRLKAVVRSCSSSVGGPCRGAGVIDEFV